MVAPVRVMPAAAPINDVVPLSQEEAAYEDGADPGLGKGYLKDLHDELNSGDRQIEMTPSQLFAKADRDGSGKIDLKEFERLYGIIVMHQRDQEQRRVKWKTESANQKQLVKIFRRMLIIVAIALGFMLAGNAALTTAIVFLSKDTKVDGGKLMDTNGNTLQMGEATEPLPQNLDSRMPDALWKEIKYAEFRSDTGGYMHLAILATVRKVIDDALHGSIVVMYSHIGQIELDGSIMTFQESMAGAFSDAGFEVHPEERRRLMGAFELVGLFNKIESFEDWDKTYEEPPKMPETYEADVVYMTSCVGTDVVTMEEVDRCTESGVLPSYIETINGDRYAAVTAHLWADATSGLQRESFSDLPHVGGWQLDKVTSAIQGQGYLDVAQTWMATGERFYCRTEHAPRQPNANKWAGSYVGTADISGKTAGHFRLKHKEIAGVVIDFYSTTPQPKEEYSNAVTVLPLMSIVTMTFADGKKDRSITKWLEVIPKDSISADVFAWGLDGPFTNATACASTMGLTAATDDGPQYIPPEAQIMSAHPFTKFYDSLDSTELFVLLADSPSSTAQELAEALLENDFSKTAEEAALASGRLSKAAYAEEQAKIAAYEQELDDADGQYLEDQYQEYVEWAEANGSYPYDNRRALLHNAACNKNKDTSGLCTDSCFGNLGFSAFPGLSELLPCDFTISLPHRCNWEIECSRDYYQAGPVSVSASGSVALNCEDNLQSCGGGGCIGVTVGLGYRGYTVGTISGSFCANSYVRKCPKYRTPDKTGVHNFIMTQTAYEITIGACALVLCGTVTLESASTRIWANSNIGPNGKWGIAPKGVTPLKGRNDCQEGSNDQRAYKRKLGIYVVAYLDWGWFGRTDVANGYVMNQWGAKDKRTTWDVASSRSAYNTNEYQHASTAASAQTAAMASVGISRCCNRNVRRQCCVCGGSRAPKCSCPGNAARC